MGKLEISLFLVSVAVGVVMWLLPKSLLTVIGSLIIIFGLLIYPIWHFPWIEKSWWLRIGALLLIASMLCLLGYISLPKSEQQIIGKPESETSPSIKTPAQTPMIVMPKTEKGTTLPKKEETKKIESEQQIAAIQSLAHEIDVNEQMINTAVELAKRWPTRSEKENFSYASYHELPIAIVVATGVLNPKNVLDREMLKSLDRYQQAINEFNAKLRIVGRLNPGIFIKVDLIHVKEPKQWPTRIEEILADPFQDLLRAHERARDLVRARYPTTEMPRSDQDITKQKSSSPIKPSKEKGASVVDLIKQYPAIDEVVKGLKSCQDLSPEAQQVCVKEISRITFAQMVLKEPGLTAEQRVSILQQTTLEDMKRKYETMTLGAVASISSKAYTISAISPEVASVYLFLQKTGKLEKGSSELLGSVSREEFPKKISQYETLAKSKHMKLILRTVAKDQTQWLQKQIKYNQEFLKKTTFLDPSNDKISEGEEWPVD
jgi:hypothetical protein